MFNKDSHSHFLPAPATTTCDLESVTEVDRLVRQLHQQEPVTGARFTSDVDFDELDDILNQDTPSADVVNRKVMTSQEDCVVTSANGGYATNSEVSFDTTAIKSHSTMTSQNWRAPELLQLRTVNASVSSCLHQNNDITINLESTIHHGQEFLLKRHHSRFFNPIHTPSTTQPTLTTTHNQPYKNNNNILTNNCQPLHRRTSNLSGRSSTGLPPTPPDSQPPSPKDIVAAAVAAAASGHEAVTSRSPLAEVFSNDVPQHSLDSPEINNQFIAPAYVMGAPANGLDDVTEEDDDFVVLTPVTRRQRKLHKGCTTIKYNRRNNPDLDKRRTHYCQFQGELTLLQHSVQKQG